jgi:hypothetical protein
MARFSVVTCMMMLSGRTMVFGDVFMVVGGLQMTVSACFGHRILSNGECGWRDGPASLTIDEGKRRLLSSAVPKPAYWRMVQSRLRYMSE